MGLKHATYAVMLLIVCSCTNSSDSNYEEIPLEGTSQNVVTLQDVCEKTEDVDLELTAQSALKNIKKIEYHDGRYYILDDEGQRCIVVFDSKGKYINRIGILGNGRGEYANAYDFTLDRENGKAIILSDNSYIYIYNLDGTFVQSKQMSKSLLWSVISNKEGCLFATNHLTYTEGEDAKLIYSFDSQLRLRNKHTDVLPKQMGMPSTVTQPLAGNDSICRYMDVYTNMCYIMKPNGENEKILRFRLENAMPYEKYANVETFIESQLKYNRIQESCMIGNRIITFYLADHKPRINVYELGKGIVSDNVFEGMIPKVYTVTGDGFISAYSIDEQHLFGNHENNIHDNYTLVRYKMKE